MANDMKILFIITTHEREELLLSLIQDIDQESICKYKIIIYEDKGDADYTNVKEYLRNRNIEYDWYITDTRHGKERYWILTDALYSKVKNETFDYVIQVPDDVSLVENFVTKSISQLEAAKLEVLNILLTIDLNNYYGNKNIMKRVIKGNEYWDKTWIDSCFIAKRGFFEKINYSCPRVQDKWFKKRNASSGVGSAVTRTYRLSKGKGMVVGKTLVIHKGRQSKMRPYREGAKT